MSFSGYGVQFADLEVAKESYFGKLAPMTVTYNSDDEIYTLYNTACVKTLSNDFTKLTFNFSDNNDEKYAYYKINGLAILTTKEKNDIIEVNGNEFKIQDIELDAEKIGRVTIDEKITFSGTEIDFEGVKTNYAHNKPVIYSLDGKEITISDAATLTTGDETKTFNCAAGIYVVNGKTFELDEAGNVSGIETAQSDDVISAENGAEDFSTMNLSTKEWWRSLLINQDDWEKDVRKHYELAAEGVIRASKKR